jgi:hypothetical protein
MKHLNKSKIRAIMKLIVWDYDVDPYVLYEVVTGKRDKVGHFDAERILIRMLERLSWYDLLNILGMAFLRSALTPQVIKKIRLMDVREKYDFVRKVLQGETVSFSGWSPLYRERIKHTLLSDRWYRTG